ncbi:MAG: hypothetical protein L3K52_05640 [Candidatus Thiothrix sulfatifontis]|jgi:hypothetical protein|nr:MAG: hypothetical protein L3K52_05640 [Candidatus Thiothrix sulfatifontis]
MKTDLEQDTLRSEYDFSTAVRGKHHKAYREGFIVMVGLEADVAKVFPDAEAVNQALRTLMRLMAASEAAAQQTKEAA